MSKTPCGCISRWKGDCKESGSQEYSDLKIFKSIGINRKPGRGDLCQKAGCIHKLAKWNLFGLQGRRLLSLIGKAISLNRIIVGNCEANQMEYTDEMTVRLVPDVKELQSISEQLKNPQIFNFDYQTTIPIEYAKQFRFAEFIRETSDQILKKPTGSCIVAWLQSKSFNQNFSLNCSIR